MRIATVTSWMSAMWDSACSSTNRASSRGKAVIISVFGKPSALGSLAQISSAVQNERYVASTTSSSWLSIVSVLVTRSMI